MPREAKPHLHNGYWRVRIAGKDVHLGRDKAAALTKWHRLIAEQYAEDLQRAKDAPDTVRELALAYTDVNTDAAGWLSRFVHFAGDIRLRDVQDDLLLRYHDYLSVQKFTRPGKIIDRETGQRTRTKPKPLAPKTIRHYVQAARSMLKWAEDRHWIDEVPKLPKMKAPLRIPRDVAPAKLREVLADVPERPRRILRFIAATGCRPSEACRLTWDCVNVARRVCVLTDHKTAKSTGKTRTLYLTDEAVAVLAELIPAIIREPLAGPVFTSKLGTAFKPNGLRSVLRRRGINGAYALRHSFAQVAACHRAG